MAASTTDRVNVKGNRLLMQGDRHFDYDTFGNLMREHRGAGQRPITATTASTADRRQPARRQPGELSLRRLRPAHRKSRRGRAVLLPVNNTYPWQQKSGSPQEIIDPDLSIEIGYRNQVIKGIHSKPKEDDFDDFHRAEHGAAAQLQNWDSTLKLTNPKDGNLVDPSLPCYLPGRPI